MLGFIEIKSNTIDAAAGEILGILDGISKHERNIYFSGWCGLGASAALRVASQRLKSQAAKGRKFDKVVHVDCTLWQSMRALQKAVAEELDLPQSVMAIFDQHDEDDDFNGIDQGSRGVILDVTEEIFRKLVNSTFVVIFHNGSSHYIDLYECGVPVTAFLRNKVLWTWSRGFHLPCKSLPRQLQKVDVVVGSKEWHDHVLHEEAAEVAKCMGILDPDKIVECFQYVWARRLVSCIDWEMHTSNYWVSDGIIQGQGDTSAWEGSIQGTGSALTTGFICEKAATLHVHDSLSITSIPSPPGSSWNALDWCRIERCPKLSSVFATPTESDDVGTLCFYWLTTFWASKLPMALYIWNWSTIWQPERSSFLRLKFLHLDNCPRLIHVLPLSVHMTTLPHLETLEIVCCGDLTEIFPLDPERQKKQTSIDFPELRHVHLHDLHRLQRISGSKMFAPKLETIKIRGCWGLRRLPAVAKQCPMVDCEKDWWDSLEWDEGDANHHPSLYKTTHSRYYKKAQLPRGTVLR